MTRPSEPEWPGVCFPQTHLHREREVRRQPKAENRRRREEPPYKGAWPSSSFCAASGLCVRRRGRCRATDEGGAPHCQLPRLVAWEARTADRACASAAEAAAEQSIGRRSPVLPATASHRSGSRTACRDCASAVVAAVEQSTGGRSRRARGHGQPRRSRRVGSMPPPQRSSSCNRLEGCICAARGGAAGL